MDSETRHLRVAYADPPYFGSGARHYGEHHPEASVWDAMPAHAELIAKLREEFPDGWALSASSNSLRLLLPLCPPDVRVAAWVKPWSAWKRRVRPVYGWEPVIFRGGRQRMTEHSSERPGPDEANGRVRDWLIHNVTIGRGLSGAKPDKFCSWVLDLLGVMPGDEVVDLFPGTGVMAAAARWRCETPEQALASEWGLDGSG